MLAKDRTVQQNVCNFEKKKRQKWEKRKISCSISWKKADVENDAGKMNHCQ